MRSIRLIAPGAAFMTVIALGLACCASKPAPQARKVDPPIVREVPSALRGTVGSMASLQRAEPILVSGYGLVVGLNGTGGGELDTRIAATMERMLGLNGISKNNEALAGTALAGKTPREVLRSRDVAVVVAYAAVIPGAPAGATFDVYISSVNRSPEVSLEGGTLWTTDLHIGPPTPFDGVKARGIARAHGPLFINPFAEPGSRGVYGRGDGRVLGGGMVTSPLPLELVLDTESHGRAKAVTEAINNRFPAQPGEGPTARGRTARIIEITVPAAYREGAGEFLRTLMHIQTDPTLPQEYARRYIEALKNQPALADDLRWCLQALPQRAAVPFLRDLYDYPELTPRLAALRAGAGLGDALAAPALKQLAREGPPPIRVEAIGLLGDLSAGPTVDVALREQLAADELSIRIAAYEALASRAEQVHRRRLLAQQERRPTQAFVAGQSEVAPRSLMDIPGDTPQGVRRRLMEGKFILDMVPGGKPMIYVSQQGRPRVVLFGDDLELVRPTLVSAWSGSRQEAAAGGPTPSLARLILTAESATDQPRLLYRYPDRVDLEGNTIPGRSVTSRVSPRIPELIEFLAHASTPEDPRPGLGMTYSEVVGALSEFQRGGAIRAHLALEQDLLRLRLMQASQQVQATDRPENQAQAEALEIYEPVSGATMPEQTPRDEGPRDLVVPLPQPVPAGK